MAAFWTGPRRERWVGGKSIYGKTIVKDD